MTQELPYAVSESTLQVGTATLRVYHLNDGRRIINGDDVVALFAGDLGGATPEQVSSLLRASAAEGAG